MTNTNHDMSSQKTTHTPSFISFCRFRQDHPSWTPLCIPYPERWVHRALFQINTNKKGKSYARNIKSDIRKRRQDMNGLMLHCGGQLKTRQEVFAVPAPPATATYAPLPYESYIVRIEKQLAIEGITVAEQRLALSKNGQRLFGLLALRMPGFA